MRVRWGYFLLVIGIVVLAWGCRSSDHSPAHQHQMNTPAADQENPANRHMHRVAFDTLVQRFEAPERERWQKPDLVIDRMGDLSGKVVADIGAGTGYFAFRIAQKAKKVIAIDIDERFLNYIEQKNAAREKPLPVETRKVPPDDPQLSKGEADIVLLVDTYHHIENRPEYFARVREKLPPDGLLMIVDFKKEEMPVGPPMDIKLSPETVVAELKQAGYQSVEVDTQLLPYQYIVTARP